MHPMLGRQRLDRLDVAHALKSLKSIKGDRHMKRLLIYDEWSANNRHIYEQVIWKYT